MNVTSAASALVDPEQLGPLCHQRRRRRCRFITSAAAGPELPRLARRPRRAGVAVSAHLNDLNAAVADAPLLAAEARHEVAVVAYHHKGAWEREGCQREGD